MKKYLYILMALVALAATGCREKLTEYDKGEAPLEIKAATMEMTSTAYAENGLVLTWTTGTNHGSGLRIYYSLDLALAEDEYSEETQVFTGQTLIYEQAWTCDKLNEMLLKRGYKYDEVVELKARIIASVDGFEDQVAEVRFTLNTYEPIPMELYLVGPAVSDSWKADDAIAMTRTDVGEFKATLRFKTGNFSLILSQAALMPGYAPGEKEGELVYRDEKAPLAWWTIDEAHLYEVRVNLIKMTIRIKMTDALLPDYTGIAFVGGMTDWVFVPMTVDPLDPFQFHYGMDIVPGEGAGSDFGEFKFATQSDTWGFDWSYNLKATEANAPYTSTGMTFVKGYDPDNKWVLKASEYGPYKIRIDLHNDPLMFMAPYEEHEMIYMVGSAAPNGWSLDDATPMTKDGFIYTWEGTLNDGELKFTLDKQGDWNGAWFMPTVEDAVPTGEEEPMFYIHKSDDAFKAPYEEAGIAIGDFDRTWNISAGEYSITLNELTEKVTIIKK